MINDKWIMGYDAYMGCETLQSRPWVMACRLFGVKSSLDTIYNYMEKYIHTYIVSEFLS